MPPRNKRAKPGDFDPTKSDSEDETYGTSVTKPSKSRSSKSQNVGSSRKKQRRRRSDDESDDDLIEESDLSGGVTEEDIEDDEEIEVGPSGRPKRKATKNQPKYEESDSDQYPEIAAESEKPKLNRTRPSLIVKLKMPAKHERTRRGTRAQSASGGNSRPTSSYLVSTNARRSSRIANDETEPVVALTNSGHHVDVLRAGTRSPPPMDMRPTRGGKGVKKAPAASSVVYEESQESFAGLGDQLVGSNQLQSAAYREIAASREDFGDEGEELQQVSSDHERAQHKEADFIEAEVTDDVAVIPESGAEDDREEEEDEDEDPISKPGRTLRQQRDNSNMGKSTGETTRRGAARSTRHQLRSTLGKRKTRSSQRSAHQESSDFEPVAEEGAEEDVSDSSASLGSPHKNEDDDSSPRRRGTKRRKVNPRSRRVSNEHDSEFAEELADELDELKSSRSRRAARAAIVYDDRKTRQRKPVDYRILRPDLALTVEDDGEPSAATPSRRGRGGAGGAWQRTLYSTYGPFGGAGGPTPVFGGPGGIGAAAGADSDSSDDENMQRPRAPGLGGVNLGITPTTGQPANLGLFPLPSGQLAGGDTIQGPMGTVANLGKVKDKSALADADPLSVDQNVNFDSVGGLQGHIDQLKEMVALPLLYPEVFQRFHVTPPRGVLFHGPPGTGKTLLARALASSVSSQGKKVTFYMRKGADALSKWVGEAERQLRLLFEEARKNQPSIIFFDEIDGESRHLIFWACLRLTFCRPCACQI